MSKHTPGPWKWMESELNNRLARRLGKPRGKLTKKDGTLLFALVGPPNGDPDVDREFYDFHDYKHVMAMHWYSIKGDEIWNASASEADKALIAAAPDLLAACKGALGALSDEYGDNPPPHVAETIANIRAAIAKAEGN